MLFFADGVFVGVDSLSPSNEDVAVESITGNRGVIRRGADRNTFVLDDRLPIHAA